jgi:Histidine kinase
MDEMPAPLDLSRLTRIAFAYLAVWLVDALFMVSQGHQIGLAFGLDTNLVYLLGEVLCYDLLWAVFTPFVVAVGERLSFRRHPIRDAVLLLVSVPVLALARIILGSAVLSLSEDRVLRVPWRELPVGAYFHGNVVTILTILAVTRLVCLWNESRERETHAAELSATLVRARLDEMHTRLQPEFLMRALHTIGNRIRRNDPSSDALIVGLSDLLRRVLALARQSRTTLEGELDLLDRYLSFCEVLSGRRIESRYEFDESLLEAEVPLMMLQPLLNEAISEATGDADSEPLRFTLRGRLEGNLLKLEVEDDAQIRPRTELSRVRERVKTFLAAASFESVTRGPFHTTRIAFPIASTAEAAGGLAS